RLRAPRPRGRRATRGARDRDRRSRAPSCLAIPPRRHRPLVRRTRRARFGTTVLVARGCGRDTRRPLRVRELLALRLVLRTAARPPGLFAVQPGAEAHPRRQRRELVRYQVPPDADRAAFASRRTAARLAVPLGRVPPP